METSEVTPALHLHPAHYYGRGPWGPGPSFLQGMGWINWLPRELAWETCLQVATRGSRMVLGSLGRSVGMG